MAKQYKIVPQQQVTINAEISCSNLLNLLLLALKTSFVNKPRNKIDSGNK